MFIINFLKALVLPNKMQRFSNMPIIISIAIFLLGSYILAYPHSKYVSDNRYEIMEEQNLYDLMVFSKLSSTDLNTLRQTKAKVENGTVLRTDTLVEGEPFVFQVEENEVISNIYIVFDLYDVFDPKAEPSYDVNTRFNLMNKNEDENYYLLVFYQDRVYYQTIDRFKQIPYSTDDFLDFENIEDGKKISNFMIDMYIPSIRSENTFTTFISTVVYTFIIIMIVWIFFRFSGSTLGLKDFYNMGSLSSIIPLVLIFILSFIFPKANLMFYYSTVFGVYFLAMMFIINSKGKIA
ncbi:MAG: hypothetical protein WC008_00345 [Bacilli bacterium]